MSWSSELPPDARPLTGRPLLLVLVVATVFGYACTQADLQLALALVRHGWSVDGTGFAVLNLIGLAATGLCVAVAVTTRLPGAATAVALLVWLLDGAIRLFGTSPLGSGGYRLYPVLAALSLLGADAVLLARRAHRATILQAALAGVVVAVLLLVLREVYYRVTIGDYAQFFRPSTGVTLRDDVPLVAVLVVGGLLGWAVGRTLRARSTTRVPVG